MTMNARILVTIAAGTLLSYPLAYLMNLPVLVPILNAVPAVPFMYLSLRNGRTREAVGRMLLWAAVMGVCATLLSYARSTETDGLFLNGERYRQEMFAWIRTGAGAESSPRVFLPVHAAHAALFCALSIASGSILSMPMGAILMNYMGHYAGTLAALSRDPIRAALLAWNPWSLVRIVSFVALGVVLAGPVLARLGGFAFSLRSHARLLAWSSAGLLIDVILKTLLAPAWQPMLRRAAGW